MTASAESGRISGQSAWWTSRLDREAITDVAPVLLALAPFGMLIGVQVADSANVPGALSGSLLLYAGSAQVSTLSLLHQGAGIASILAAVVLINARFLVYSARLADRFDDQPTWFRWLAPHFIIDQTYGLVNARDPHGPARFRRYWLTVSMTIAVLWVSSMTVGALIGPALPPSPATALLPAAVFIGLLIPSVRDRPGVFAAVVGGALAAVVPVSPGIRVLLGTTAGAAAGLVAGRRT